MKLHQQSSFLIFLVIGIFFRVNAQPVLPTVVAPSTLNIDSTFLQINYYNQQQGASLLKQFKQVDKDKVVIFHFGGSHIQGDILTSMARNQFVNTYGNGGRGMIFAYGAADTYSSLYYSTSHKGKWIFGKSFMSALKLPLGICGMAVETKDIHASLGWKFKQPLKKNKYKITLLTEVDSLTPSFIIKVDSVSTFTFNHHSTPKSNFMTFAHEGEINQLQLQLTDSTASGLRFRFFGFNIETEQSSGVVYHALGVGAAPMRAVLNIEKLKEHAEFLKPDIVVLDFGTNDILYTNAVEATLAGQVEQAIALFRAVNPEVHVLLTTPQDLFYKKRKSITAGIDFRNLMDSLARKNNCLFWNWFDLSGGLRNIKVWESQGYAQPDLVHLTVKGYHLKGQLLYDSFIRTLQHIEANPQADSNAIVMKSYETIPIQPAEEKKVAEKEKVVIPKKKTYTVKKGDTLSEIAQKHNTTVAQLKKLNKLTSDQIRAGNTIRVK